MIDSKQHEQEIEKLDNAGLIVALLISVVFALGLGVLSGSLTIAVGGGAGLAAAIGATSRMMVLPGTRF